VNERLYSCLYLCTKLSLIFSVDGMFGRCEAAPLTDVYTYDVTPATVQRFRTLLQKLAHREFNMNIFHGNPPKPNYLLYSPH
uniref:Uncharacterized protein n=1 Tax=Sinocyclocheilus grahami TaxID=75366 RepID=A0A672N974_SINGR